MSARHQVMVAELGARREGRGHPGGAAASSRRDSRLHRRVPSHFDPHNRNDVEDNPHLRALAASAQSLIRLLQSGITVRERPEIVAAYAEVARLAGIAGERVHDAIELLVHDHARVPMDDCQLAPAAISSARLATGSRERSCGSTRTEGSVARRIVTAPLLQEILRLADPEFASRHCPHSTASALDVIPHWCRSGKAVPSREAVVAQPRSRTAKTNHPCCSRAVLTRH